MENSKEKKIRKILLDIILIILILIFVFFLLIAVVWFYYNTISRENINNINQEIEIYEDVGSNVEIFEEKREEKIYENEKIETEYSYYVSVPFLSVKISDIKNKNSDTVGFINVNNTNINYPVVKGNDNDYYLTHSFDKKYNPAGWIFLDYRCDLNTLRNNTIIYGHNRLDNTLFGSLTNKLNTDWYDNKENRTIRVVSEEKSYVFQIFSTYMISMNEDYLKVYFESDEEYQKYIDNAIEKSVYNFNSSVTKDDKILTLSTCGNDKKYRVVVHAKLVKTAIINNT